MITTVIITIVVAYALYLKSDGNIFYNGVSAAAITLLIVLLQSSFRDLPPQAYFSGWLILTLGLQFLVPLGEGRLPSFWVGNRCFALTVITVGV